MTTKKLAAWRSGLLGIMFAVTLAGCAEAPPYGPHAHYDPYDYYFYPSVGIYFRYSTGYYYYPSGTVWVRTRQLPPKYHLDQHDRIIIRVDNDKPYEKHQQHRERYHPNPAYRSDSYRDEKERYYNQKRYEEYRNRR